MSPRQERPQRPQHHTSQRLPKALLVAAAVLASTPAPAAVPDAAEILRRVDAIMAPDEFESDVTMVSHRKSGDARTITMHVWKKGISRLRLRMLTPPDDAGSEILRDGDSHWNYLPNLKRALRISPKQEFHGGDFNNTDILRVNLSADYRVALLAATAPDEYLLQLTAKNDTVSYDRILYWVRRSDFMPLRQEFYTASGKLIRKLDLLDVKPFNHSPRPSRLVMHNMLAPARYTEMTLTTFAAVKGLDEQLFQLTALGH